MNKLFFLMKSCDCSKKFKNLSLMTNGECDHVHFCNKTFVSLQNKFIILQDITTQHNTTQYITHKRKKYSKIQQDTMKYNNIQCNTTIYNVIQ